MKITLISLALLLSTGLVSANPTKKPKPEKPAKPEAPKPPTVVNQVNQCGNNNAPYCCAADGGSYVYCSAMGGSSICSQTIVCCNANDSVQNCVGNVNVEVR